MTRAESDSPPGLSGLSDPSIWVDRHGDILFRIALARVGDRQIAEDLVQDTFLAALKARSSFAGQADERTWFVAILKNKIVDHFRKQTRQAGISAELSVDLLADFFFAEGKQSGSWQTKQIPATWRLDPLDAAELNEFWEYLQRCVEGLDRRHAVAFVMREIEGLETSEICNVVGVSATNLRVLLFRSRQQLRKCLEVTWIMPEGRRMK